MQGQVQEEGGLKVSFDQPSVCSFVTFTSSSLTSTTTKRSVRRLRHRSTQGLVVDSVLRMVYLIGRRLLVSLYRSSTDSLRIPLCGMRTLSPILMLLSSPHSLGSPNRYSTTSSSSRISNSCQVAGSHRAEQLRLYSQQHIVDTVEDSVLWTEMDVLESQEEDTPKRILFFKPMSCLGQIRSHRRDETWSLVDILSRLHSRSDPSDCGEEARDLWLQEISVRPPR